MVVSLYTSRVVLQVLGVEDYGIYSITGGFIASFIFINNAMAGATSRFITYEIGRNNFHKLNLTFNMAFYIHLFIACVILLLAETVGLWFLNNQLVIPENRLYAANIVYQLSVFSMMIGITQTPYMACVLAHEKMDVYAYVELLNVFLKLGIVFLLMYLGYDKLVLYASLIFAVSLLSALIYRFYCILKFRECRLKLVLDRDTLRPMLSYSGWDFYGHLSDMARNQGVEIVINLFFGPVVNAASNIAKVIQGAVNNFASSITAATKPQIIKYYASGNYEQMVNLTYNACKLNTFMLMLPTIPLLAELHFVMSLWLVEVPENAVTFCSLGLIFNLFGSMSSVLINGVQATGKLKRQSLINGTLYLLVIPTSYLAYKAGAEPWIAFLLNVVAIAFGMMSNALIYQSYISDFRISEFIKKALLPCFTIFVVGYGWSLLMQCYLEECLIRLFCTIISSITIMLVLSYFLILPYGIKVKIKSKLHFI